MRFSTFIKDNLDQIVMEWEAFAKTLPPGKSMSGLALRDHCQEMLLTIANEMEGSQTGAEQSAKAKDITTPGGLQESAAELHGTIRQQEGFDIVQLVAEFRALRASVLSL